MSGKSINFNDKKIKKSDFYENKRITRIEDIDVNKILVSKKEAYGTKNSFKYFIGYNDNDVIRPLLAKLPQMTGYARKSFQIRPVYGDNDKYIKTKIKYMLIV